MALQFRTRKTERKRPRSLGRMIRRFHRERDGQSMVLVVLVLFTLVCFLGFTINVGHRVTEKIEMQNTIDAATYSAAAWNARGLNAIAVLNVTQTEILAIKILAKAYDKVIAYAEAILPYNQAASTALCANPWTAAFGCPWKALVKVAAVALKVLKVVQEALDKIATILWKVTPTIQKMEAVIRWAAPMAGEYRASEIADDRGADSLFGLEVSGVGLHAAVFPLNPLPVETGDFEEICKRTLETPANPKLVKKYVGWTKSINLVLAKLSIANIDLSISLRSALKASLLPLSGLVVPPIGLWETYLTYAGKSVCSSSGSSTSFEVTYNTTDLETCQKNDGTATWYGYENVEVDEDEATCENSDSDSSDDSSAEEGTSLDDLLTDDNTETVTLPADDGPPDDWPEVDDNPYRVCKITKDVSYESCSCSSSSCTIGCSDGATTGKKKVITYYKSQWTLIECEYTTEDSYEADTSDKPQPYILETDADDYLQFSGIAYKTVSHIFTGFSVGEKAKKAYVVSRANVYNPTTEDTFTQDWRVSLEPFTMDGLKLDVFNVSKGIGSTDSLSLPSAFTTAMDTLETIMDKLITH